MIFTSTSAFYFLKVIPEYNRHSNIQSICLFGRDLRYSNADIFGQCCHVYSIPLLGEQVIKEEGTGASK